MTIDDGVVANSNESIDRLPSATPLVRMMRITTRRVENKKQLQLHRPSISE
jgi:hypothetical protein